MISSPPYSPVKATMSYNDHQYRERDRSNSNDRDDRYPRDPEYNSRRSNWSSSYSYDRRSEIPCRFGMKCRNPVCPYRHDDSLPVQQYRDSSFDRRASIPCRHGMNCTRPLCPYKHESEASSYSSSTNVDRIINSSSMSIGKRFEPPPLVPPIEREQPPQHSSRTQQHSQLKSDFSKRFVPPSKLCSSISHDNSTGERQGNLLSKVHKSKDKQSEITQQQLLPDRTAAKDADRSAANTGIDENNATKMQPSSSIYHDTSVGERQEKLLSSMPPNNSDKKMHFMPSRTAAKDADILAAKPETDGINDNLKADIETCDSMSEPKPMEIDLPSKLDVVDKQNDSNVTGSSKVVPQQHGPQRTTTVSIDSNNCNTITETKQNDSNNVTGSSMGGSQPTEQQQQQQQQQVPQRTMPAIDSSNGNAITKTNPIQKVNDSLRNTPANSKANKPPELKPNRVEKAKDVEDLRKNDDATSSISKSESQPTKQQQQVPQRTMTASIDSNNGNTIAKTKPAQKATDPLRNTSANSTTIVGKPPEPKRNRFEKTNNVAPQSTSILANLLSSQRRTDAALQRYRLQKARPFEKIIHDIPSFSTVPNSYLDNESVNRTHVSTKQKDDEMKDALDDTKKPTISKLVAKENKAHTKGTKKRKIDEIKSTADSVGIETAATTKLRKKSKDLNPFRVKVGSVVAVRFRNLAEGGNPGVVQVAEDDQSSEGKPNLFEAWSEPIAGRHDGVSLLGSRIKCVFAKCFVEKWLKKNANFAAGSIQNSIEGNVVTILGSSDDDHGSEGIAIGLLVNREKVKSLPFLQVISDDNLSSPKQKIEDKIRGEINVTVKVILASVMEKRKGVKLNRNVVKQWFVRSRVIAKPSGKKLTKSERKASGLKKQALFVGDGNDTTQQQEKNWRWVAARTDIVSSTNDSNSSDVASQLVGEVTAMTVHDDPGACGSLATVTIRRLWTPQQTKFGRTGVHVDHLQLFDDHDGEVYFTAPVEYLVVIGKNVSRHLEMGHLPPKKKNEERNFCITHSYNASDFTYKPLSGGACDYGLCKLNVSEMRKDTAPSPPVDNINSPYTTDESISSLITSIMESSNPINFTLPNNIGSVAMRPSFAPNTGSMKSGLYSEANPEGVDKRSQPRRKQKTKRKRKKREKDAHDNDMHLGDEEDPVKFKPTCSRTIPFDDIMSNYWYLRNKKTTSVGARRDPATRENALPRSIESKTKEEVTTLLTGRAARANQRRMVKSLGTASAEVDRLAGRDREHYLRFGKSTIEGWGVFAEEPINAGDLIIEYRGELIGHAVADKREREYEAANVPDYMFRIDAYTVCDATRLGNVARFINASCSPNCYTQIIKTANENKRIVIYAKKDIARGEELCYDYKFPIEMDPAKRIPCGCGSIECRGYMNWDNRWG